ncbi:MAG: hypothetical protein O2887_10985 [Bacteroidetes bacterium]|nr:hypothetical protein [Bacteroidota bacterium]MDA1120995.1 hypothetical protein [Bacteroidota bacterium]
MRERAALPARWIGAMAGGASRSFGSRGLLIFRKAFASFLALQK